MRVTAPGCGTYRTDRAADVGTRPRLLRRRTAPHTRRPGVSAWLGATRSIHVHANTGSHASVAAGERKVPTRRPRGAWASFRSAALGHRGRAALQLVRWHIFFVGPDVPVVSEWILDGPHPVAVELVLDGLQKLGALGDRRLDGRVHVVDVEHHAHRRATVRSRGARAHFMVLVSQHDHRITDLDLGVPDLSLGTGHP